jgi:hypothetical protein
MTRPFVDATPNYTLAACVMVPGTSVYYAPAVPANYFFYKDATILWRTASGRWHRPTMGPGR